MWENSLEIIEYNQIRLVEGGYRPTENLAWIRHKNFGGTELCQLWRSSHENVEDIWVKIQVL